MAQSYSLGNKKVIGKQYRAGIKAGREIMSGKGIRGQLRPVLPHIAGRFSGQLKKTPKQMYAGGKFKKGDRSYMRGVLDAQERGARVRGSGVSAGGGG
jgi:hypothetical protein